MLSELIEDIKNTFGGNLSAILQYGSSIIEGKIAEDIDLIIVLIDGDHKSDIYSIKDLILKYKSLRLDMQLLYADELFSGEYFSIDNHGNFFLEVIKRAKVLFGENPTASLQLDTNLKRSSLFNQIQHYVFRARQELMGLGRFSKDQNRDFHRKKIKHILGHILMLTDEYVPADSELLNVFIEKYPEVLRKNQLALIKDTLPIEITEGIDIYESLYGLTISLVRSFKDKLKTKRINYNEMIIEYSLANNNRAIILLDGLPSVPDQKYIMKEFVKQGYDVFFPRYLGTWESDGEFLSHNPAVDIADLVEEINQGINIDGMEYRAQETHVIASSFGGSIALTLPDSDKISSIISLSPVTDFTKLPDMKELSDLLKKVFPGAYRFRQNNWNLLSSGELIVPNLTKFNPGKHFILGGEKDPEVTADGLKQFSSINEISLKVYPDQGHMSFSALKNGILSDVLNIMRAKCLRN